ncbi:MAG: C-GCAxxG-C-C family protein [Polyangiaceae bacterium]
MSKGDEAAQFFTRGYNCAQSTAAAFAKECGVDEAQVLTAMAGFGGGLGGMRETCGAVNAMAYVAGLIAGEYAPEDVETKTLLYARVQRMVRKFESDYGTLSCRELLAKANCVAGSVPSVRTSEYYAQRPCAQLVAAAASIIDVTLLQVHRT